MSVEIRFDADSADDLAVLDAHIQAMGNTSRKEILNGLLAKWVRDQVHVATMVCRARRINPLAQEPKGRDGGTSNE